MIAIGNDHAGVAVKKELIDFLTEKGYEVEDCGTFTDDSCDYPDYALKVCEAVKSGECEKGILICGTGIGVSISANKVKGIRCALCHNEFTTELSRKHNDANVLALGARVLSVAQILSLSQLFLNTEFEGGRHARRVEKIMQIENSER